MVAPLSPCEFLEHLRRVRRDLHERAETGFQERDTSRYISELLISAGFTVKELAGGLTTELSGTGKRVLLRAELDALPLTDTKAVPYASKNEGACHACGHDGHMAMLYGAALLLKSRGITGGVRFAYQPAEERPPGGAINMVRAGVLDGVNAAFALHLSPYLPFGTVGLKAGALMAAADDFRLTVKGKSGHGAMPQAAVDAVLAASHTVTALQALVSRMTSPLKPLVLTVGKINGGSANNVVADKVTLEGTIRTLDTRLRDEMPARIENVASHTCAAFGAACELEHISGYPPLFNDGEMTALVEKAAADVVGKDQVLWLERPMMGSEDFAYFLERVPGCFIFLGTKQESYRHSLHHPCFDFNEEILPVGAELLYRLTQLAVE